MSLTTDAAKTALRDVAFARERSLRQFGYRSASPYLLLWGVLWAIAGAVGAAAPGEAATGWLIVDAVGIAATGYLVVRDARRWTLEGTHWVALRYAATVVILAGFVAATGIVFAPVSGTAMQMFVTLLIAAIYMIGGLWLGHRFTALGAALAIVAAGALHLAPAHQGAIVAVIGGGALFLGGLWMRKA